MLKIQLGSAESFIEVQRDENILEITRKDKKVNDQMSWINSRSRRS